MTPDSFSFDGCNSVDDWGLRVVCYDVLFPAKRPRKAPIPRRSGQYDYGAESWEERTVRISCTLERKCTRAEVREIAAALARKGRLRLWNEPDKYYIAELYDPAELTDYFDECMREFELRFVCEPFAYADARTEPIRAGDNALPYRGAIPTPCRITIVNPNKFPVSNITIVATGKRRQTT